MVEEIPKDLLSVITYLQVHSMGTMCHSVSVAAQELVLLREEVEDARDMLAALTLRGWLCETASLYDEEGVDGWIWTEPSGREHHVVGAWDEPPPWPESAAEVFKKGLSS